MHSEKLTPPYKFASCFIFVYGWWCCIYL